MISYGVIRRIGYFLRVLDRKIFQSDIRALNINIVLENRDAGLSGEIRIPAAQDVHVDYDKENFTPMSAESILMEGMRMIDEWPIIERKISSFDMVFAGRQAIDGDTAQVGPQTAEKLGIPQITYAESIESFEGGKITARRALDRGSELVRCSLPCLLTVVGSAPAARPASVRRRIAFKRDAGIESWTAADIGAEESRRGFAGSPTQVHKVNFVVLEGTESKDVPATAAGISALVDELVREYVIG